MSKLARSSMLRNTHRPVGVLKTEATPSGRTGQGAPGYARDVKSELFTLAVTNFVSEKSFYESGQERDERFVQLIHQATNEDARWTAGLLKWLRGDGNMRSASIVGAIEYGRTFFTVEDTGAPTPRAVLNSVMQRADEPGEALGYWLANYGRPLPKWLKRALGDGALRHYTPFSVGKYDGQGQAIRFSDVLHFSQISRDEAAVRGDNFFKWIVDRRYGRAEGSYGIEMLDRRQGLESMAVADRKAWLVGTESASDLLNKAGYTWESLSGWLQGPMDAKAWEAIIPSMGYMALLRNLRNFDEANVSKEVAATVAARLADPEQVARSRQLPMRFLSAYKNAPSDRWKVALGEALDLSLKSVPTLSGKTLVLIDVSGSMSQSVSDRSSLAYFELAAMFGIALAASPGNQADVYSFDTSVYSFNLTKGASALNNYDRFVRAYSGGGATYTARAIRETYKGHDRVVVLTDEQANSDGFGVYEGIPAHVPCYTYNIAGYRYGHAPAGTETRRAVAGLTDSGFKMMSWLEGRTKANKWPWQA